MAMIILLSVATVIATIIYSIIGILLHIGLLKKYKKTANQPMVSVLIAARNEEKYLSTCLESLKKQNYPEDLLQIIVINDRSTDKTRDIISDYCKQSAIFNLLDIHEDLDGLKGKMNALSQGLDQAIGEIILITDADCRVSSTWISAITAYFTEEVGLVGSFTVLSRPDNRESTFDHIQTMDWLFLQAIASGTTGIGLPVSVLGNNFGFRKSAYDEIGGFKNLGFSLTEDMVLLKAIISRTKYRAVYPVDRDSRIYSIPLSKVWDFFQQRQRWLYGGLKAPFWGWVLMFISFIAHLVIVLNIIFFNWITPILISMVLVLLTDFSFVWRLTRVLYLKNLIKYFPVFEIFYILYTIFFALKLLIPGKIRWKERTYVV
jgi:cellulose synthase/poly-beta-1,6-N-acetylglucosamine synthase-like glycosyltransferase